MKTTTAPGLESPPTATAKPAAPPAPVVPPDAPVSARPLVEPAPLTVVPVKTGNTAVVSLRFVFHVGSAHDPKGKEGLTALTTRLLVEGGTKKLTAAQLADALYPMAAELSADTDKEFTVLQGRVHVDRLDRFLDLVGDVLTEPRLENKELQRLKAEQLNALTKRLRNENDEELGKAGLDALLYEGHPYRHPAVGTEAGLSAITLDDVRAHLASCFTQQRLLIGIAGPVDDALVARVKARARVEKLPATGTPVPALPPTAGVHGRTLILQRDTDSTAGSFGVAWSRSRRDPDFIPLLLGFSALGEHRQEHGVLFQEVRDKRGLNYGTYAYAEHYRQDGWDSIPRPNVRRALEDASLWLRPVESKNAVFATRATLFFTHATVTQPLSKAQLDTAKGFLVGATRLWTLTDQRRLGWAIDDVYEGTHDFPEQLRQQVATLGPDDVQRALAKAFDPAALNYVFVTRDAAGLAKALTSQEPSPITYPSPKDEAVIKADALISRWPLPMKADAVQVVEAATFLQH